MNRKARSEVIRKYKKLVSPSSCRETMIESEGFWHETVGVIGLRLVFIFFGDLIVCVHLSHVQRTCRHDDAIRSEAALLQRPGFALKRSSIVN